MFTRRPVARLSMMTTSWFCAKVSARFEARAGPPGDDVAHEEAMAVGVFRGFFLRFPGAPGTRPASSACFW